MPSGLQLRLGRQSTESRVAEPGVPAPSLELELVHVEVSRQSLMAVCLTRQPRGNLAKDRS